MGCFRLFLVYMFGVILIVLFFFLFLCFYVNDCDYIILILSVNAF